MHGGKRKNAGRQKGSKNERTEQWSELSDSILGKHTERFNSVLAKMNDEDFANMYVKIINYFKPRFQSTEHKAGTDTKITVTYERNPNRATRSTDNSTE